MSKYQFQTTLIDQAYAALCEGLSPVIQSHPGSGKTVMAIAVANMMKCKTLVVVPWREIRKQIVDLTKNNNLIDVMTVNKAISDIEKKQLKKYDLIIFDEAHHTVAKSYQTIIQSNKKAKIFGLTGTLVRMDGEGFTDIFDTVIEGPSVEQLIKQKVLCDYKLYVPDVNVPLFDKARLNINTKGEYSSRTLVESFDVKKAYALVHQSYTTYAKDKQMILYAPSVEHAISFAEYFNKQNIKAAFIHSEQSDTQRDKTINDFKNGAIDILCNYNIISEGFDMPDCDGVILVRPTRSLSLFIQQSMRAMRYRPNKTAIIIDHTLNSKMFGTPTSKHLWRLEGEYKNKKNQQAVENELNTRLKQLFSIDTSVQLVQSRDSEERIVTKNQLIFEIEQALESKQLIDLIKIQTKYNIGYISNMAWSYRVAKTYGIPIPKI